MASLFGDAGMWDSAASSMFFTETGVDRLLNEGGDALTVDALLAQDSVIQDVQAHSERLLDFLTQPASIGRLLLLLSCPQDTAQEDLAYRFPYMACELIACAVRRVLDAIVDRQRLHLLTLFAYAAPCVRDPATLPLPAEHRAVLEARWAVLMDATASLPPRSELLRPYLAGYWCKIVALLCKKRPAAMVRFFNGTPGIAAGLVCHLQNGSFAALLCTVLDLPFQRGSTAMGRSNRLARGDTRALPDLLLDVLQTALARLQGRAAEEPLSAAEASACENAAEVLATSLLRARSASPHVKFSADGYNDARLRGGAGTMAGATGDASSTFGSTGGGGSRAASGSSGGGRADGDDGGWAGAGSDATSLLPPRRDEEGDEDGGAWGSAAAGDAALAFDNTQLDPAYCAAADELDGSGALCGGASPVCVNIMRWARDGPGAARLVAAAVAAAAVMASSVSATAGSEERGGSGACGGAGSPLTGTAQLACAAAFRVLTAALEAAELSWRQRVLFPPSPPQQAPPPPAVLVALLPHVPALAGLLRETNVAAATAAAANAGGAAPAPSSATARPLGVAGLALVRALCALSRCGWPAVTAAAAASGVFGALLDSVASFPWHSILHRVVADALLAVIHRGPDEAQLRSLLFDAGLLSRIVAGCKLNHLSPTVAEAYAPVPAAAPVRVARLGYAGHLVALANALLSCFARGTIGADPATVAVGGGGAAGAGCSSNSTGGDNTSAAAAASVRELFAAHSDWWRFVDRELAVYNIQHALLIGGMAPDVKKSGNVGFAADATARSVVDEVAALDNSKAAPGGADDDRLSGGSSSDEEDEGGEGDDARRRRLAHLEAIPAHALVGSDDEDDAGAGSAAMDDAEAPSDDWAATATAAGGDWAHPPAATGAADFEPGFGSGESESDGAFGARAVPRAVADDWGAFSNTTEPAPARPAAPVAPAADDGFSW